MDEDQEVVGGEQLLPKAAEKCESERGLVMPEVQICFLASLIECYVKTAILPLS